MAVLFLRKNRKLALCVWSHFTVPYPGLTKGGGGSLIGGGGGGDATTLCVTVCIVCPMAGRLPYKS